MTTAPTPYVYRAFVDSVYDGDTITVSLDLGLSIKVRAKCRLLGIDTPEVRTKSAAEKEAAYKARDRLRELVLESTVTLHSVAKPDKYGRLLVTVWAEDGTCINDLMINEGLAIEYNGGKKISYAMWT